MSIHLSPRSVTFSAGHVAFLPVCRCWCPPFSAGHVAFLFNCLPGLPCWCPPFSAATCLFICFSGVSLLVSALFRWPCTVSIHLSPRSVTAGVRPFPLAMQHFYSIHLSPRSVTAGVRHWPCGICLQHFYSFVSQVCHCWCPPFSGGHAAFLFICLRGVSLLVSALFRWRCNISSHSPHSLPVRRVSQFFLKMFFYSFVFKVISLLLSLRFAACTAGVRPYPLAMQHFYSFVSHVVCLLLFSRFGACTAGIRVRLPSGLSFLVSLLVGHCVRLVSLYSFFVSGLVSLLVGHCVRLVSLLSPFVSSLVSFLLGTVSVLSPLCFLLSPFLSPLLSPFLLVIVSALSSFFPLHVSCASSLPLSLATLHICLPAALPCNPLHLSPCVYICLPALDCCVRLCLAILYICLPALGCGVHLCLAILYLHLSPSAGLLCPPLPCNPLHVSSQAFAFVSQL